MSISADALDRDSICFILRMSERLRRELNSTQMSKTQILMMLEHCMDVAIDDDVELVDAAVDSYLEPYPSLDRDYLTGLFTRIYYILREDLGDVLTDMMDWVSVKCYVECSVTLYHSTWKVVLDEGG